MKIPAGVRAKPTRPSPTTISLSLSSVPTTSVCTSIHSIETSTRSTLETRKVTGTFAPFSNPSTKRKESAVYSETSERKTPIRKKRSYAKNETRNMTEVSRHLLSVSPEPREPSTAEAGVISSPHFEQDKTTTDKSGSLSTTSHAYNGGLINCCH